MDDVWGAEFSTILLESLPAPELEDAGMESIRNLPRTFHVKLTYLSRHGPMGRCHPTTGRVCVPLDIKGSCHSAHRPCLH